MSPHCTAALELPAARPSSPPAAAGDTRDTDTLNDPAPGNTASMHPALTPRHPPPTSWHPPLTSWYPPLMTFRVLSLLLALSMSCLVAGRLVHLSLSPWWA